MLKMVLGVSEQMVSQRRSTTFSKVAKTVGVEEAGPRRPLLDFAERNFEIGAGG